MKRRRFFQQLAAASAVPALVAQQSPAPNNRPAPTSPAPPPMDPAVPPAPYNRSPPMAVESPKLETATADEVAEMAPRFFSPDQFATLQKLSDVLMPPIKNAPGALTAGAPEFLDFLLSESSPERQKLYRSGLDTLQAQAKKRFSKPFGELDGTQASALLSPLKESWTYEGPTDPLAKFLWAAKQDVRTATMNSREYASTAGAAGGRRGAGGTGLYWYPLD